MASGSGEAELAHLEIGRSYSHTLDCLDELSSSTISPSSLGTLVLAIDSSPRAFGGVEY